MNFGKLIQKQGLFLLKSFVKCDTITKSRFLYRPPSSIPTSFVFKRFLTTTNVVFDSHKKEDDNINELEDEDDDLDSIREINRPKPDVQSIKGKYSAYVDEDAEILYSAEEIQKFQALKYEVGIDEDDDKDQFYLYQSRKKDLMKQNLKRGKDGVFDLKEFVEIIQQENLKDIAVIKVPKAVLYTDYLVIGTAMSIRHMKSSLEFINKVYKMKKRESDPFLEIEGKACDNWKSIDMGKIVFHVFLEETRNFYDIESLWTIGEEFDSLCHEPEDPWMSLSLPDSVIEGLEGFSMDMITNKDSTKSKINP